MSRARGTALAVLSAAAAVAGCNEVHWTASPYPIPLALSGPGGGLMGRGTVDGVDTPFAMVVDTGTVLTTYDSGSGQVRARTGELTLFGVSGSDVIPRLSIRGVPLFEAPLGSLGVGDGPMAVRGILAGDNLS